MTSSSTKVTLLLRQDFSSDKESIHLKPTEFRKVENLLLSERRSLESLLSKESENLKLKIQEKLGIEEGRLSKLLNSGFALGLALDRWKKLGIWVISIYDEEEYPLLFKERYRDKCPLLLFGCGDKSFLQTGGLGVVGPRNAPEWALTYAKKSSKRAAEEGVVIISGGAKGIDSAAMEGCLEGGGRTVNVISSNLGREVLNKRNQQAIRDGQLTLISTEKPETGWSAGLAMARNKFIYLLSSGVLVVNCEKAEGGTWSGASECLTNNWSPVYVKPDDIEGSGNTLLLNRGALEHSKVDLSQMKKLNLNHSRMKISEIALLEDKSERSVKNKLTREGNTCLDYPEIKTPQKKQKKEEPQTQQQDLFN